MLYITVVIFMFAECRVWEVSKSTEGCGYKPIDHNIESSLWQLLTKGLYWNDEFQAKAMIKD